MILIVPPGLVIVFGLLGVLEAQTTAIRLKPLSRQYALTVSPAWANRLVFLFGPRFHESSVCSVNVSGSVMTGTTTPGWEG